MKYIPYIIVVAILAFSTKSIAQKIMFEKGIRELGFIEQQDHSLRLGRIVVRQ